MTEEEDGALRLRQGQDRLPDGIGQAVQTGRTFWVGRSAVRTFFQHLPGAGEASMVEADAADRAEQIGLQAAARLVAGPQTPQA